MPTSDDYRLQIVETLKERYFTLIPQLATNWPPDQHEKNRLSRSLAAFAISQLGDVSSAQAANAVIDGLNDNGIDAVYLDRSENRLWLVQSKIGGAPDLAECKKFVGGISDILAGRFDRFNEAFARLQPDVEEALSTEGAKIIGCVIHLGDQLGPHAIQDLNTIRVELNRFADRFDWRDLGLTRVHGWLTAEQEVSSVDASLTLEKWHGFDGPRRVFYGQASAKELASLYRTHGRALLERNIRHYMGLQAVNSAIAATVHERPLDFFYLNNGLTAVCTSVRPVLGASNDSGTFSVRGLSIVNGAQTLGSIAAAASRQEISQYAKVLLTIIEVASEGDAIGPEITRARNTQNAVRGIHFAALDPQQERLRQELAVSGVTYQYRPSDDSDTEDPNVITLSRAAVALACLSGDTRVAVSVKRESGQLYDVNGEIYSKLFRTGLSGIQLARAVRVYDRAMDVFFGSERAEASYSRRKMFYRHGRPFILHLFARRNRTLLDKAALDLTDGEQADVSRGVIEIAELTYEVAETMFRDGRGYLAIFRNVTDCGPLAAEVMRRLTQPTTPQATEATAAAPTQDAVE